MLPTYVRFITQRSSSYKLQNHIVPFNIRSAKIMALADTSSAQYTPWPDLLFFIGGYDTL